MNTIISILIGFLLCGLDAIAQVPDAPAPAPTAPPAPPKAPTVPSLPGVGGNTGGQGAPSGTSPWGGDLPFLNPGTEIITWNGKSWNITNQRFFQARFEKYLNAPEETTEADRDYQTILRTIMLKLAPDNFTSDNLNDAWRLLPQASNFRTDAKLCDALADAVYSSWQAKREQNRLSRANGELEMLRRQNEWNAKMASENNELKPASPKNPEVAKQQNARREQNMQPFIQRLAEVNARIAANTVKREVSELQAKIEFQALIVQLFIQRRFQHVVIGTRFYRHVFNDGDTSLKVGNDTKELFMKGTGMPPTVGTLDSMANEAMRDVHEGVDAFKFLLEKNELESATKRLGEAFLIGEYMPDIRTLPRDQRRQALLFTQKAYRLLSALEVKDYTQAELIVKELEAVARDFNSSLPMAAIETARTVSGMHLAKAKNAAVSGDKKTLEEELKEATAIWPRNPALADVSKLIFSQADVQQKALVDLDQLISQRNYRQIFDDKVRFIAATALYPDRQEKLKKVLEDMQMVEGTIIRCNEIAKRGDTAGAWESAERAFQQFPEDNKLNQLRANLTIEASDFVRSLRTAQQLEVKDQTGSSLAWYLKAQKIYPPSEFAQEGIYRLVNKVLPNS